MELKEQVLTEEHIDQLSRFFTENTEFTFVEFLGYLVGVASAPRETTPTEWQDFFLGTTAFEMPDQEKETRETMEIVYCTLMQELEDESYDSSFFAELEDKEIPEEGVKTLMLQWLTGYWLGLEIGGEEWTNTGMHEDSIEMLCVIDEVGELLEEDEKRFVTVEDIETVQANVKSFFDYWQENRHLVDAMAECEPTDCETSDCMPTDCEPTDCTPSDCMPTDCKPTDCKPKSENKSRCC